MGRDNGRVAARGNARVRNSRKIGQVAAAGLVLGLLAGSAQAATVVYDNFEKAGGYTLADYAAKWSNIYGPGEMAFGDTRDFSSGAFFVGAKTFQTGADFSVYDHLKYIGVSTETFAVPTNGSVSFSSTIDATTYGTQDGRIIEGTYTKSHLPYAEPTFEGQQAAAVMNMIDFSTGQLFDWFISGKTAFTLIERLPSLVTNPLLLPGDPGYVGLDKAYTQIIDVIDIGDGPQDVSITYSDVGSVQYFLNGKLISSVDNVGIPLDRQGHPYSGVYPSLGPGEALGGKIHNLAIGHGLFSLLDAFPFRYPGADDYDVSIPVANRIFGQGVEATFDDFTVTTLAARPPTLAVPEPASWATMILGFGVSGAALRRRRRAPA